MNNYRPTILFKTKLINLFRLLFTIPYFEKFLISRLLKNSGSFLYKLVPPNYLYKKYSPRYATRQGINYKLDISKVVDHNLYYGYTDADYNSVLADLKTARVILDIGANIGNSSLYYTSINPDAQILAFEPHPDTYKLAAENLKLNKFPNIHLINIGLGEKRETLKLYEVNDNNPGMNRILTAENDFPFKTIEVDRLDNVCREQNIDKIDFIKIDVEGFEYSVLAGGKEVIQKSKPVLFIELDDNNLKENNKSAKALIELLVSFGYNKFYKADDLLPVTTDLDFNNCHFDLVAR
jgi:FkbM family methyltransferase